ncbi:MAG TPA: wax ester/triacylglycerol synthase domain-containing protein [Acidimicrobiia bacterium]|nr:wax ester/triacylglycerol synthase domain-containing protein [Acidimicrobiia bacterium]
MSDTEAIMWAVEKDPALRSDFCNLTILESLPTDERMRHTMARAVAAIPRLGQRVVGAPLRIVPPAFADDPMLDLSAHVRRVALPGGGSDRALLDLCGALAEQPLDRARPLWEFTLIEGLDGGRAALLQKIHHTITDGVGGLKLSLAFVDFEPDAAPPVPPRIHDDHDGPHDTPLRVTRTAIADLAVRNARVASHLVRGTGRFLTQPSQLTARVADAARLARSLQRQVLTNEPARSDVMHARSLTRHFETHALSLPAFQTAAKALGGSVNDLYVAGLAGALGRYHEHLGSNVSELRLAMPISTRNRGDDAANRFVPARLVIPIQPVDDPQALFAEVQTRLGRAKGEAAIGVAENLAAVLTGLPTSFLVAMTRAQTRTTDFAATNLRGSPVPIYIAGTRVIASYPFGPRTGTALNATVLSYCDELHLGLNIDPAAITDVKAFMSDVDASFDAFLAFA